MFSYYYTNLELDNILKTNNIDKFSVIDCNEYLSLNGWSIRINKKIENESVIIKHNGILKKIENFCGYNVCIAKDDKYYSALMDSFEKALLVCILIAIKNKNR